MSVITDTVRGLVQRRLWPVAVGLAAGVAAVPFVLASDPQATPAAGAANGQAQSGDLTTALVSVADAADGEQDRVLLGSTKDPFKPAASASKDKNGETKTTAPAESTAASGGADASPSATAAPSATPTPTPTPSVMYPLYSLSVRWASGDSTDDAATQVLERLDPLPDAENPLVIYLGLLEDGKTAVFLLDSTVKADGDGTCLPSVADCQTVQLKAGQTEFFDVESADAGPGDASSQQFQLDVVKVHAAKTTSPSRALAAYAKESKAGRKALREQTARSARYRYDAAEGHLVRLRGAALERALERAASAAESR